MKDKIISHCLSLVEANISELQKAIKDSQNAANNETKSTAGDKHDTARSMMQIEVEKLSKQMAVSLQDKANLLKINPKSEHEKIAMGSVVFTSQLNFFISVGLGRITLDGDEFYCMSTSAPLTKLISGKSKGDTYVINGKEIEIKEVL